MHSIIVAIIYHCNVDMSRNCGLDLCPSIDTEGCRVTIACFVEQGCLPEIERFRPYSV